MRWKIGQTTITRIEEMTGPMFDPVRFLPDYDPAVFEANKSWLYPDHVDPASGNLIASMHSWLIETSHHKILIDTCVGDDKSRMPFRNWHEMKTPWLHNFEATGVKPGDIDFVMCTHLHVDHVGWNTRLENGQWVPTFPNARYIMSTQEYEHSSTLRDIAPVDDFDGVSKQVFDDSIRPIMHLADLIDGETEIIADLLRIIPSPGHTPGSIAIELTDQGQHGLFTGDICHHPIQVVYPDWNSAYCEIDELARMTRLKTLTHCSDHNALMLPAHFGGMHAGYVEQSDNRFNFDFASPY